jgi:hypothetical protein
MSGDRFWDDCADAAIRYINAQADSRDIRDELMLDLRRSYADQLSARRWENRNFNELVDGIVAAYDRVDRTRGERGDTELDIIDKTVEIVVDGHFAELVLSDDRVSNELSNAVYAEMKDARREAREMVEGSRRERRHDDDDDDRGRRSSRRDRDDRRDSRRDDRRSSSRDRGRGSDDTGSHWMTDIGDNDDDRRDDDRDDDRREPAREERQRDERPEYHHTEQAPRREDPGFVIQGPDYTKADPYSDYWLGDEHYQAAHVSDWKLTGDGDNILSTIPTVYDVNTHIKYYVMNERGEVREELIEVTDDNRYMAHQLREETREPDAKPRTLSAGISLTNREDSVIGTRIEQRSKTVRLAEILREIPEEQLSFAKADTIDSIQGAVFESQVKMVNSEDNAPRIDLHILRTPVLLRDEKQLSLIDQVHAATTLTEASELLMKLKPEFEKPLWENLNRRFSVNTIRASTYQFQFDVAKLNFATSYGKLLAAFRERRGAEEAVAFAKRMHFISDIACCHIVKEDLPALAGDLIGDATNVNAAVFIDFAAIISVDYTLDDIGLGLQLLESKEGLVIEPSANNALFLEIRKLYSRLDEELPAPQKGRLLLSTSDNRLVEVLPFAARKEAFILAMAQL